MRLIKPYFEIWNQPSSLEGVYKQIERVGRVCYKSEDKITEDSAKLFVDRMIKSGHGGVLEHGTIYLLKPMEYKGVYVPGIEWKKYVMNPYTRTNLCSINDQNTIAITTNYRVLVENNWLDDLKYICEPTEFHEKRITVHFVCDRGVSHEFVRHRVFSFAQESTRYCNYSKDKFDNEITYILPPWIEETDVRNFHENSRGSFIFLFNLEELEEAYIALVKEEGWKPQQARAVLPNALKTELVMTGFVSDWEHFFSLRALGTTGAPHPQAKELAEPLMKEFIARKYINN